MTVLAGLLKIRKLHESLLQIHLLIFFTWPLGIFLLQPTLDSQSWGFQCHNHLAFLKSTYFSVLKNPMLGILVKLNYVIIVLPSICL